MVCAAVFAIPPLLRSTAGVLPICSSILHLKHAALCYCTVNGNMKSKRKPDHLERTAHDFRQEIISKAKVCGITSESETVKRLRLAVTDKEFTFKAGQWVDFFIPGVAVVGGFSICSSPGLLQQEGVLELAVKQTTHPPAHWVHTQCTLGSEVALRVGGNFFFDPQPADAPANLVLVAGGVGINPLFSILLHVADLQRTRENKGSGYKMGTANLFYCAKNTHELLFRKHILGLTNTFPGRITCSFHVTKQSSPICENLQPYIKEGRISADDLEKHISTDTLWYICGPPAMIESISKVLANLGVTQDKIFFEKWW
nr:oxidoreductase NAD-binding domain-containing protein 1 [Podarcis muralis]XP_028605588.1 oxidoreductase NAD-binding domain-containing protein 1 [Podarcis muralis]XP_028605589.1 oxidoreductase NAD-binding domain-containing protein 1 [Podarcis muralis]XP_028605590.1 oxidoreductase NAD-binding domain-containing protein 1 [Podarcis muralis]XP_028605591.1 oxidoreductase NAD-binding domain-containing protein 1 [Podarcis muralis]XP_028605592.1 oxidoreductase NAD-binding domain-containing protein 1 